MPSYITPGVFVETSFNRVRAIQQTGTSTAAFIGYIATGPIVTPVEVLSWTDYVNTFGGIRDAQYSVAGSTFQAGDAMGQAIFAFFAHGGRKACICRTSGVNPDLSEYANALKKLVRVKDVNVVLLPGLAWDSVGKPILERAISHCETTENRMAIIDIPAGLELHSAQQVRSLNLSKSSYASSYYPWPLMRNPLFTGNAGSNTAQSVLVSPAAVAAGIWARIDEQRGVWKAPAGMQAGLTGVDRLEYALTNTEQDFLSRNGINAIRHLPSRGFLIWGARTLATQTEPQWRYLPVRRTAMMIRESLTIGSRWAVFEHNDNRLWSSLREQFEQFLATLFRSGAFQGEKQEQAYFVNCGLGQTMTQQDILSGTVVVEVGFAPLKPAEFVVMKITQKLRT